MLKFENICTLIFRKAFLNKNISDNDKYINIYCYGEHTNFSNDCIRWFIYYILKNAGEYNNICHEYETYVELSVNNHSYIYSLSPSSLSSPAGFSPTNFSKDSIYITFSRTEYTSACIFSRLLYVVLG